MTNKTRNIILAIGIPILFALLMRFVFDENLNNNLMVVMSTSFLVGLPVLMGFLTIWLWKDTKVLQSKILQFVYAGIPIICFFLITLVLAIEGWACWLMMLPAFLILSGIGGLIGGNLKNKRNNKLYASVLILLPFILGPIEHQLTPPKTIYRVITSIEIKGAAETIWDNVTRVRTIADAEDHSRYTKWLGLPRPIKAELDFNGVGAHRKAIFDKGLVFDEDVTEYEDLKRMKFTITANPYDIPSTTMDKHIVIGGDYFDVLTGEYRLISLADHHYRLELDSEFVLSTTFNYYAGFWAKLIMKDIQVNILRVIRERVNPTPDTPFKARD
ncbi:MAG: hypothetical protein DHS20C18_32820 [Saprospiraceae bacterium]|nr:MAG: hypothetical protein DHS20C18_32820 [Saprospiraceae bacterium]